MSRIVATGQSILSQRDPREHEPDHLAWIRTLPCVVCLDDTATEAAHVRLSDARAAKVNPGVGQKPHDRWTVPLCSDCHREQHDCGDEAKWWALYDRDPILIALALYSVSGDYAKGMTIIRAYH